MTERLLTFIESLKADESIYSFDEAATKQGIILKFLSLLGWDTFNIGEVRPEYSVGTLNVDYSLRINDADKVFLEAKRVKEELENHQKQLLNYSFEQGVEHAILTNGITWWFYLPLLGVDWEQRKFYSIDIFQQEPKDIASRFVDFLARENIDSGQALENARAIYKSQQRQKILHNTLPKAWEMIVSEPDELLVELINERSEKICGYKADDHMIRQFLSKHRDRLLVSTPELTKIPFSTTTKKPTPKLPPIREDYTKKKISAFQFKGQRYQVSFWNGLLVELCSVINALNRDDFSRVSELRGTKGSYFTRDQTQLTEPKAISGTDLFVETCWNANNTVKLCRRLIALFGYSDDDLKIELKTE